MTTIRNLISQIKVTTSGKATFGRVVYGKRGRCGPRIQSDFQIVFIFSGRCSVRVDDKLHPVLPGEWILLEPGRREHFFFSDHHETDQAWVSLHPSVSPESLRPCGAAPITPVLRQLFDTGLAGNYDDSALDQDHLRSLAVAILTEAIRIAAQPDTSRRQIESHAIRAWRFIELNFARELTLEEIARAAGVSRQHLITAFRAEFDQTPIRALWNYRTKQGAELLRNTGLTITEIADRVGFQNPYHFSRAVRQQFGKPPRQLREAAWDSQPS